MRDRSASSAVNVTSFCSGSSAIVSTTWYSTSSPSTGWRSRLVPAPTGATSWRGHQARTSELVACSRSISSPKPGSSGCRAVAERSRARWLVSFAWRSQLGAGLRENDQVTMGRVDRQGDLFDDVVGFCEGSLPASSIYGFLARERDRLFPNELFDDLFSERGRASVPPSVVATVMVLQRLDGLSDREAVERYAFDVRWRYAAGVGGYGGGGWGSFAHTVLVDMRARLRRSTRPNRIFEVGSEAAYAAGLVGRRRVLDLTPLYDGDCCP
jgi:hypothetical protein